ncbi:Radical SAM superfamily enzyme, MoaA/NifB/PqqE/SkfB family [Desulfatibacillum alkenivorans DSM 16219]|uniref:Radical SAM superfamily enzyme, MoaA/NifB/PqqE/SkfB family n=1 Tax=Desulfatibacillum alkenivorans DSM 16219 TaxID=1121393 RepID=A0A1M6JMZ6_9BACT|nr:radical SAM protein [Desulfatibacillum alkenivorans]SHJ47973.1 Radical SAM superfamily enzyme, MoaA/NifB/PqqE/SkfB family [Desulfatibacillum alkenivorans DSM 16219]
MIFKPKPPPLTKIYVEPTTFCNLSCPMCMRHCWEEPGGAMTWDVFQRMMKSARQIRTLKSFSFWGIGEPLMHPDIFRMINAAKKIGAQTEMISNGHLLTPERSKDLIKSGLDVLIVSLEGTSPESYAESRQSDFHLLMENIDALNKLKAKASCPNPKLGLEFVITAKNIHELPKLPEAARRLNAVFLIISNLLPYGDEPCEDIAYWLATGDLNHCKVPVGHYPELRLPRIDARPQFTRPVEALKNIPPYNKQAVEFNAPGFCPFVGRGGIAVRWDGSVAPCVPLMHSHRCWIHNRRKTVTQYHLGAVTDQGLDQIWRLKEYVDFRKRVLTWDFPPCIQCDCCLAEENKEDCCGSAFPACGDCLWAHNIVVCP